MASAKKILEYERELKNSGVTDKQAEVHAQKLADIIESTLVTKNHFDQRLKEFEIEINFKFTGLENRMDRMDSKFSDRLDRIDSKVEMRITQMEGSIYKFLITVMMAMMAVSGAMQTIFHYWR